MFLFNLTCLWAIMGFSYAAPHSPIIDTKLHRLPYEHLHSLEGHVIPRPKKNVVVSPSTFQHHCNAVYNAGAWRCFHPNSRLWLCIHKRCEAKCSQDLDSCQLYCSICVFNRLIKNKSSLPIAAAALTTNKPLMVAAAEQRPDAAAENQAPKVDDQKAAAVQDSIIATNKPPVLVVKNQERGDFQNSNNRLLESHRILSDDVIADEDAHGETPHLSADSQSNLNQISAGGKSSMNRSSSKYSGVSPEFSPLRINFNLSLACDPSNGKSPEKTHKCMSSECGRWCTDSSSSAPSHHEELERCVEECVHIFKLYMLTSIVGNVVLEPFVQKKVKPVVNVRPVSAEVQQVSNQKTAAEVGTGVDQSEDDDNLQTNITESDSVNDAKDLVELHKASAYSAELVPNENPDYFNHQPKPGDINSEKSSSLDDGSHSELNDLQKSDNLDVYRYKNFGDSKGVVEPENNNFIVKTLEDNDEPFSSNDYLLDQDLTPIKVEEDPENMNVGKSSLSKVKAPAGFKDGDLVGSESFINDLPSESKSSKVDSAYDINSKSVNPIDYPQKVNNIASNSVVNHAALASNKGEQAKSNLVNNSKNMLKTAEHETPKNEGIVLDGPSELDMGKVSAIKTVKVSESFKFSDSSALAKVPEPNSGEIVSGTNSLVSDKTIINSTPNLTSDRVIAIKQTDKHASVLYHDVHRRVNMIKIVKSVLPKPNALEREPCRFLEPTPAFYSQCLDCLGECALVPHELNPCSDICLRRFSRIIHPNDVEEGRLEPRKDVFEPTTTKPLITLPSVSDRPRDTPLSEQGDSVENVSNTDNDDVVDNPNPEQQNEPDSIDVDITVVALNSKRVADDDIDVDLGKFIDQKHMQNSVNPENKHFVQENGEELPIENGVSHDNVVVVLRKKRKHTLPNKIN